MSLLYKNKKNINIPDNRHSEKNTAEEMNEENDIQQTADGYSNLKTVQEVQEEIFEEINDPANHIQVKVQRKELNRENFLKEMKDRCVSYGLNEDETTDIVFLVDKALWGFGIIDNLINDPDVSDIRLINENSVRIKKLGERYSTQIRFANALEYERYIEFITNRNNTSMSITNAAQIFTDKDTCKTDILRFSLVSKLLNSSGKPTLLIRKIPKKKKTFEDLINAKYCTAAQRDYLQKRWRDGYGILVSGPNGSGKTTLVNAILDSTPKNKSAVIIQESEELFCDTHTEMVFRKVIPPRNGSGIAYELKDLSKLALTESFDIIVVGEIKGGEAADISYATYTGSQAMTTVHANSASEAYEKIIDYALDEAPNRTREHYAKQIQSLSTSVYVKNYKIIEIKEIDRWDKSKGEYIYKAAQIEGENS